MAGEIDISEPDFDRWLAQVFAHPLRPEGQKEWYWDDGLEFSISSPQQLVTHVTKLCSEFNTIAPSYTIAEIDQGIWYLMGPRTDFGNLLTNSAIPLDQRLACVKSMYRVYSDFTANISATEEHTCFDMWWDLISDSFWGAVGMRVSGRTEEDIACFMKLLEQHPTPEEYARNYFSAPRYKPIRADLNSEEASIHDSMLDTLVKILDLPDSRCQLYALHGLGHLHHPQVHAIVQRYIDSHRTERDARQIRWLEQCRDGEVM